MKRALLAALVLAAQPALAADKMTVMLDWFVNPDHGPELFVFHSDRSAPRPLSSGRTGGISGVAITADGAVWLAGAGATGDDPRVIRLDPTVTAG